jgi:hypothetical protein
MLLFGNLIDTLFHRLRPYSLDVPGTIVVNDSRYLRGPTDIFMGRKPTKVALNQMIKVLSAVSIHLVTPLISGITPGSSTLLSIMNQ